MLAAPTSPKRWLSTAVFASLSSLGASALAQGSITGGTVIAFEQDSAPDAMGVPIPGVTFSTGGPFIFGDPQIDASGNVLFRARLDSGGQALNGPESWGYFFGTNPGDLRLALRGLEATPGLPNTTLGDPNFTQSPFGWEARLSSDGSALVYCFLDGAVNAATNGALLSGPLGSSTFAVQRGDVAPGTGGATFDDIAYSIAHGANASGEVWFLASLTPGTGTPPVAVDPTNPFLANSFGIWAGQPDALELVALRGSPLVGNPALVPLVPRPLARNDAGQLLYKTVLSPVTGTPPATQQNNELLALHAPGLGSTIVAREGDPVPGAGALSYGGALEFHGSSFHLHERSLLRTGEVLFLSGLQSTVMPLMNGEAVLRWNNGVVDAFAGSNQPTPGVNGTFGGVIDFLHNSAGIVAVKAAYTQAAVPAGVGIWIGPVGAQQLVAREGQVLPGTGGGVILSLGDYGFTGDLQIAAFHLLDTGQLLFSCTLEGGSNPGRSLWSWTEATGLLPILLPGDVITLPGGATRQIVEYEGRERLFRSANGDGGSAELSADGTLALRVRFTDGTSAILSVELPVPFESYCQGGSSNPGNCGNCPCANGVASGTVGGCLNSESRSAQLVASGSVIVANNSLRFDVTSAVSNSFAILLSGDNRLPAMGPCPVGTGLVAFDGLRCAGGALLRHGSRAADANGDVGATNAGWGGASAPVTGLVLSSGFSAGQTRNFQAFYRDDPSLSCQTGQNSTNAVAVTFY